MELKRYYIANPYFLTEAAIKKPETFFEFFSSKPFLLKDIEIYNTLRSSSCLLVGGRGVGKSAIMRFLQYKFQKHFHENLKSEGEFKNISIHLTEALENKPFIGIFTVAPNPKNLNVKDDNEALDRTYVLGTYIDILFVGEMLRCLNEIYENWNTKKDKEYTKYIGFNPEKMDDFVRSYLNFLIEKFQNLIPDNISSLRELHEIVSDIIIEKYNRYWDNPKKNEIPTFCLLECINKLSQEIRRCQIFHSEIQIFLLFDQAERYMKLRHTYPLRMLNEFIYKIARELQDLHLIRATRKYGFNTEWNTQRKKCLNTDHIIERSRGEYDIVDLNKIWISNRKSYKSFCDDIFRKRCGYNNTMEISTETMFGNWQDRNIKYIEGLRPELGRTYGTLLKEYVESASQERLNSDFIDKYWKTAPDKIFSLASLLDGIREGRLENPLDLNNILKDDLKKYYITKTTQNSFFKKLLWIYVEPYNKYYGWDGLTSISFPYPASLLSMLMKIDNKKDFTSILETLGRVENDIQFIAIREMSQELWDDINSLSPDLKLSIITRNMGIMLRNWQKRIDTTKFPRGIKINASILNKDVEKLLASAESYDFTLLLIKDDPIENAIFIEPVPPLIPHLGLCPFTEDYYVELEDPEILINENKKMVEQFASNKFEKIKIKVMMPPKQKVWFGEEV